MRVLLENQNKLTNKGIDWKVTRFSLKTTMKISSFDSEQNSKKNIT